MEYRRRIVDRELGRRLESSGAVLIEGPKACGKTATARQFALSEVLLDVDEHAQTAARAAPATLLAGEVPRLIDEWQLAPQLWNHVRRAVDNRQAPGQFILTGSAVPADDIARHTGAGRISRIRMRPMSLHELGHSSGAISVGDILGRRPVSSPDPGLTIEDMARVVAVGGWPSFRDRTVAQALQGVRDYLDEIRRTDIGRVGGVRRDPDRVGRLLMSLARNVGTSVAATKLAQDASGADGSVDDDTVRAYLAALERLMIVEDQPAWATHLRSRSILRTASKRHFVDPSLAVAAMRATPERLLREMNWFGFLFESLVVRDLRIYGQANDAVVRHYRDNTGLEIDAILESADGTWAAFEVKLGQGQVDEAAANLLTFSRRVDTSVCGEPATLGVIVATGYGYTRDDGIAVIPIGALRD